MSRIELYDTTLRDGSACLRRVVVAALRLDELGFDYIEGGYPASNPKDSEYFQRVRDLPLKHARVAAFGMTRRKNCAPENDEGLQVLRDSQSRTITIVGKTWDLHVHKVLGVDEAENLAMIGDTVGWLASQGRELLYDAEHFFDGYFANPDFALKTIEAAQQAGARMVILCDTNGGRLPEQIAEAVQAARRVLSIPVGIHCHNDCDLAVANSLAAVEAGAVQVQGTINGVGERCGNADLVSVAANLALKKQRGVLRGDGVARLTELSRYVYELANMNFRSNQPFVGTSAFAHKGGMHVNAVNKLACSYEHIPPETVGNVQRVLVSELSGRSNIVAKTTKFQIQQDSNLMVLKQAGQYTPKFWRIHYRVNVETEADSVPLTEATVKLRVGGQIEHVVGEGDGPVNALDRALRKALLPTYPRLAEIQLVDYKVRVINSAEGTAARVRVVIESRDGHDVWSTIGVSENVIEASWLALVDSVEYKLFKDAGVLGETGEASREARS